MIPPPGEYRYELLSGQQVIAVEEARLTAEVLSGVRASATGAGRHEVEARLAPGGVLASITARYTRGPFSRSASYRVDGDLLRGSIAALAGRNAAETKLGRFHEVDGDLILFKALIIAHVRLRGHSRFTGRVATIDPNTLVAASHKQTYRQRDAAGLKWTFEPLMGEAEEIELDEASRILRRTDRRGTQTVLRAFRAAG